jgi:hypothetical protein
MEEGALLFSGGDKQRIRDGEGNVFSTEAGLV